MRQLGGHTKFVFLYSKTSFLRGLFSDRTRPGNTSTYPARPLGHPDERQKHRRCLAPPHERCRASLNATHGKILLICFLLAGTSQRSPKTTRYRHSGSQKHCRKCTSARPRFHVSCQTERVRSPDKSLSEVELAQPATQLTFPTSKKRGAFKSSQPCLLTLPLKFWKG